MAKTKGSNSYKYDAFISYSHSIDGKLAPAVQNGLQRFAKRWFQRRALRVFRDTTTLAMTDQLWPSIKDCLNDSDYLVLLASPESAASVWVQREVEEWLSERTIKKILLVLTDGEIQWDEAAGDFDWKKTTALPKTLKSVYQFEPKYVDLRFASSAASLTMESGPFRNAIIDLAATIHGRDKDEMAGEDLRQHRNRKIAAAGIGVCFLTLCIVAAFIGLKWAKEKKAAEIAQAVERAQKLAASAELGLEERPQLRLLLAHRAVEATRGLDVQVPEAEQALRNALAQCTGICFGGHAGQVTVLETSEDGRLLASGSSDGSVRLWTIKPGAVPELRCILKYHIAALMDIVISQDGRRLVTADDDLLVCVWDLMVPSPERPLHVFWGGIDYSQPGQGLTIGFRSVDFGFSSVALGGDRWLVTRAAGNDAYLWDLTSSSPEKQAIALSGHQGPIHALAVTPDGKWAVTGSADKTARLWSLESPFPSVSYLELAGQVGGIRSIAVSPDSRWLATGTGEGPTFEMVSIKHTVYLWDLSASNPAESAIELPGHKSSIVSMSFSRDSRWLVTSDQSGNVFRWDLRHERPERDPIRLAAKGSVYSVCLSGDGRWLAAGGDKSSLHLWDLRVEPPRAFALPGHEGSITSLSLNPSLPYLVSGSQDGTLRMWDLTMPDPSNPEVLLVAKGPAKTVAMTPDHEWITTGHERGEIRLWNLARFGGIPARTLSTGSRNEVKSISLSNDGRWLASSGSEEGLLVFDLRAAAPSAIKLAPAEALSGDCRISGDGLWLAFEGNFSDCQPMLSQFSGQGWARAQLLPKHPSKISFVQFGQTGRWLATGTTRGIVRLWDLTRKTWKEPAMVLRGHGKSVTRLAFSPRDRWLAVGSNDGMSFMGGSKEPSARLWDLKANDPSSSSAPVFGHQVVNGVGFIADGKMLFVAGGFARAQATLWRIREGAPPQEAFVLRGGEGTVLASAASCDGRRFAMSSADGRTFVWDLAAENPVKSCIELPSMAGIRMLSFSGDGQYLLALSSLIEVRRWSLEKEAMLTRVFHAVGRNMSYSEWEEYFGNMPYEKSFPELEVTPERSERGPFKILKRPALTTHLEGEKPVHVKSFYPDAGDISKVQQEWENRRSNETLVTVRVESDVLKLTHKGPYFYAPYTVRENRTLTTIAQEVYGSERYAEHLSKVNSIPIETSLEEGAIIYVVVKTVSLPLEVPKEQVAVIEEFIKWLGEREVQIKWGKGEVDLTQSTSEKLVLRKYDVSDLQIFARGTQRPKLVLNFPMTPMLRFIMGDVRIRKLEVQE